MPRVNDLDPQTGIVGEQPRQLGARNIGQLAAEPSESSIPKRHFLAGSWKAVSGSWTRSGLEKLDDLHVRGRGVHLLDRSLGSSASCGGQLGGADVDRLAAERQHLAVHVDAAGGGGGLQDVTGDTDLVKSSSLSSLCSLSLLYYVGRTRTGFARRPA